MRGLAFLSLLVASGCASDPLDEVARSYVELVRAHASGGAHEPTARSLLDAVARVEPSPRAAHLARQIRALDARTEVRARSFDEESELLYGVVAPRPDPETAEAVRRRLDDLLPGDGDLRTRLLDFQKRFAVPEEKLDAVLGRALLECRSRTREHLALPEDEGVTLEYVRGKPWPSFSTYLGSYRSRVQVNRDYPLPLGKVVEIAAHEAYPGHHVASVLLERDLVRGRGLVEYGVEPEVGPDALVREGLASFASELVFPEDERLAFERDVLFPLAGLDPEEAERYATVERLTHRLDSVTVDIARRYMDGERDRVQSVLSLETEALSLDPWGFLRFVDRYRTYVVTYTVGADRIRERLERAPEPWRAYPALLSVTRDET
jgi:hypothetical protein